MSAKPIAVGDLVEVISPSKCNCCFSLGFRFVVQAIEQHMDVGCIHCKKITYGMATFAHSELLKGAEIWRLKRIDPPAVPESTETERELTV